MIYKPSSKRPGSQKVKKLRQRVEQRDGKICCICAKEIIIQKDITLEHKHPIIFGGSNGLENLGIAHDRCNNIRSKESNVDLHSVLMNPAGWKRVKQPELLEKIEIFKQLYPDDCQRILAKKLAKLPRQQPQVRVEVKIKLWSNDKQRQQYDEEGYFKSVEKMLKRQNVNG